MIAIIVIILEVLLLSVEKNGSLWSISNSSATLLIALFSICFVIWTGNNKRLKKNYSFSLCLGYLFRVAILYFDIFGQRIYSLPNMVGDATVFYREAVAVAEAVSLRYTILPSTRGTYPIVMGRLFALIGTNRLYGQFLSMLCSVVSLVYFAYILSVVDMSDQARKRTFMIICLLPNFAILSTAFLREAVICMFLTISLYFYIKWLKYKHNFSFFMAAVLILPAAYFHGGSVVMLIGYIAVLFFYNNKNGTIQIKISNIVVVIVLLGVAAAFLVSRGNLFLDKFTSVDSIEDIANTSDLGRTSYARYVGNSNSPVSIVIYTIPRLFFFLFSPLPWMWTSFGDIIAFFFSSMFYMIVLWKTIKVIHQTNKENRAFILVLLVIAMSMTFVFAWGTANAGTAARHRDKMVTIYGLLLALCLDHSYTGSRLPSTKVEL